MSIIDLVQRERDTWWGGATDTYDAATGERAGFSRHLGFDTLEVHDADSDATVDFMNAHLDYGWWKDGGGDKNVGLNWRLGALKMNGMERLPDEAKPGYVSGADFGVNEAALQAYVGESGASFGLQANIVGGGFTHATSGTDIDDTWRVGASLGEGAALRAHWSDVDGDGHREYGLGADLGPLSGDLKTEDPLYWMARMASFGLIGMGQTAGSYIDGEAEKRTNYTEAVQDFLGPAPAESAPRGAPKAFGEMDQQELFAAALFNPGMNPEVRRRILGGGR